MVKRRRLIRLLWTGGWDSTYRLLLLSREDVVVEPHYLLDESRKSSKQELRAMEAITRLIKEDPRTRFLLLPLVLQKVSEIEVLPKLQAAWARLHANSGLGRQYVWLAAYARLVSGLEFSCEKAEAGHVMQLVEKRGRLRQWEQGVFAYQQLDPQATEPDLMLLLGGFYFPVSVYERRKREMKEDYLMLGAAEVMHLTWFCHRPYRGEPCGLCVPCRDALEEGLDFRFTRRGLFRARHRLFFRGLRWFRNRWREKKARE